MKYRMLVVVVCVVAMCAPASFALTRMGAPAGTLGAGKGDIGFDYMYAQQNVDWNGAKLNGVKETNPEGTIKRLTMQTGTAKLGYGLLDKWDIYGILGGAQVKADSVGIADGQEFSSGTEFMYGCGTKLTFWQAGAIKLGALGQIGWVDNLSDSIDTSPGIKTEISADIMEAQVAIGPTYQLAEGISLYGGPFMHLISGNINAKRTESAAREREASLEAPSRLGVYIGVEAAIGNSTAANIEYQYTAFANAVGANIVFRF